MGDRSPRPPAAPGFLSDAARAALEQPIVKASYPARDDVAGWTAWVHRTEASLGANLAGVDIAVTSVLREFGGVPTFVHTPDRQILSEDGPVYLNIHGGALLVGGGDLTRLLTHGDALSTGILNWAPDYRMPPRHPYPAALDDVLSVYRALLETRRASQIVVGGASAGGNLAAALLLRAEAEGLEMPAALVLLTPEVDLTESGDSFATLADVSVGLQSLREINLLYADGHDLAEPLLSPLFGDVGGFPPTLLIAGTRDLFLSNTARMHRRLRESGVPADLHIFDGRPHAGFGDAPEEAAVASELGSFVRRHLGLAPLGTGL